MCRDFNGRIPITHISSALAGPDRQEGALKRDRGWKVKDCGQFYGTGRTAISPA
ncbi:hypothetical protein [Candidatus Phycosocius bacilliformis]|uniref:hypothetical protein n=1 Tax=Candidatus Phycosocius bacilliformis TaxID=1445552 RepID=UPI001788D2D6|nr:hypothetical protein [Candidatus Phycosocius bacilliformis]